MRENIKVSILIPLYNAEAYIGETLDSCLNQSYENIEIIIVDDGSTDSSLFIVKEYAEKNKNIKIATQKNLGASAARNKAFDLSSGEYIQYLDADDLLDKDKILLQMSVLKNRDNKTISFGIWGTFTNTISTVVWQYPPVNKNYDSSKNFLIDLWTSGMAIVIHSWLIPWNLIEMCGGWDESLSMNDDGDFSARVIMCAKGLVFVAESRVYYRKGNDNSLSQKISKEAFISKLNSFSNYTKLMKNYTEEKKVRRSLGLIYSRNIYFMRYNYPEYNDLIVLAEKKLTDLGFTKPLITKNKLEYFLKNFVGEATFRYMKKLLKK